MREVDEVLSAIALQVERLCAGDTSEDVRSALYVQLMPLLRARADQISSGRARSLEATIAQSADEERLGTSADAEDVFSAACLYWWGDDGTCLARTAALANDSRHFISVVLLKVKSEFISLHRKRGCRIKEVAIENAESREVLDDLPPFEVQEETGAIFDFLAETRLGGGPLLCFRFRSVVAPPLRLSDRETAFLKDRRRDASEFLARSWASFPPSRAELAESLGYADRNPVDQHLRRARMHVERHQAAIQARFGDLS